MNLVNLLSNAKESGDYQSIHRFHNAIDAELGGMIRLRIAGFFPYEIQDVYQDFFLKIIEAKLYIRLFPDTNLDIIRYIFRMLRFLCIDKYNKKKRRLEIYENYSKYYLDANICYEINTGMLIDIETALTRLKNTNQKKTLISASSGKGLAQIASDMNLSLSAVKNLIYRARKNLKSDIIYTEYVYSA